MAGRLGAIFGAPRFTPGFPADGFGGTRVAVLTTGFGVGIGVGFAAGFAAGFAGLFVGAVFAAGFAGLFVGAVFATGFAAGFTGVDLAALLAGTGAWKRRERMPFFSATGGHELHEIRNAAAVTPLVVIPGHYLGKVVAEQHGAGRVNDCRA